MQLFINMFNLDENEIEINDKKIGFNSVIKLNVKTIISIVSLLWIILTFFATVGYFNIKKQIETEKVEVNQKTEKYLESIDNKIQPLRDDIKELIIEQGKIQGDIKVILDRTSNGKNLNNNISNIPPELGN